MRMCVKKYVINRLKSIVLQLTDINPDLITYKENSDGDDLRIWITGHSSFNAWLNIDTYKNEIKKATSTFTFNPSEALVMCIDKKLKKAISEILYSYNGHLYKEKLTNNDLRYLTNMVNNSSYIFTDGSFNPFDEFLKYNGRPTSFDGINPSEFVKIIEVLYDGIISDDYREYALTEFAKQAESQKIKASGNEPKVYINSPEAFELQKYNDELSAKTAAIWADKTNDFVNAINSKLT